MYIFLYRLNALTDIAAFVTIIRMIRRPTVRLYQKPVGLDSAAAIPVADSALENPISTIDRNIIAWISRALNKYLKLISRTVCVVCPVVIV